MERMGDGCIFLKSEGKRGRWGGREGERGGGRGRRRARQRGARQVATGPTKPNDDIDDDDDDDDDDDRTTTASSNNDANAITLQATRPTSAATTEDPTAVRHTTNRYRHHIRMKANQRASFYNGDRNRSNHHLGVLRLQELEGCVHVLLRAGELGEADREGRLLYHPLEDVLLVQEQEDGRVAEDRVADHLVVGRNKRRARGWKRVDGSVGSQLLVDAGEPRVAGRGLLHTGGGLRRTWK